jgi:hypothetical protein
MFSADPEMMQKYCPEYEGLNTTGVSAGDDRQESVDGGWSLSTEGRSFV